MSLNEQELLRFLKKQVALEERIARIANESAKDAKNIPIKELISGIALDSRKHAGMLRALIALVSGPAPFLVEKKREEFEKNIEEHIQLEKGAIEAYTDLLKKIDDERMKPLIQYVLEDERKHHELLRRIDRVVIEAETLTEEDLWDIMWKDTLFHGAPGG